MTELGQWIRQIFAATSHHVLLESAICQRNLCSFAVKMEIRRTLLQQPALGPST